MKYEIANDNFAEMFGYQLGEHVIEMDIVSRISDYALNHNGLNGYYFIFDQVIWNILDLNHQMPLTLFNVLDYALKYVEELPANFQ
jgi:hypothetical protein